MVWRGNTIYRISAIFQLAEAGEASRAHYLLAPGVLGYWARTTQQDWELEQLFGLLALLYGLRGVGEGNDCSRWRGWGRGLGDLTFLPPTRL